MTTGRLIPDRQCVLAPDGDDRVEGARHEVGELQLDDGPLAHPRRSERRADEPLLGDRRVEDAVGAELLPQPFVTPNAPPKCPMSSPNRKTRRSARTASASASRIASTNVIPPPPCSAAAPRCTAVPPAGLVDSTMRLVD
jgi:hypothetical protein